MPSDESVKLSEYVYGHLTQLKEEYGHKSYDSLFRQLLRESDLLESGGRTVLSNPQGGFALSEPGTPYWLGTEADSDTSLGVPVEALDHNVAILGQTGRGKSTLSKLLFSQQIQRGEGGIYFDRSGQETLNILQSLPADREEDVIVINPSDDSSDTGFNLLKTYRNPGDPGYEREVEGITETVLTLLKTDSEVCQSRHLRNLFRDFPEQETTLSELYVALSSENIDTDTSADPSNPWLPAAERFYEKYSSDEIEPLLRRLQQQVEPLSLRETIHQPSRISLEEALRKQKIILVTNVHSSPTSREVCFALVERLRSILLSLSDDGSADESDVYRIFLDEVSLPDRATFGRWLATAERRNHSFVFCLQPATDIFFNNQNLLGDVGTVCVFNAGSDMRVISRVADTLGSAIDAETLASTKRYHFYLRSLHSSVASDEATKIQTVNGMSTLINSARTDSEVRELIASSNERYGSDSPSE